MRESHSDPSRRPTPLIRGRVPTSRWLVRIIQLAALALVFVLAWRLLEELDWDELWRRMSSTSRPWILAAAAALSGRLLLLYLRWLLALEAADLRPPWLFGLASQLAAVLVNHLTPTARLFGGVFRASSVSRKLDQPFSAVFGTVLVDQVSHQVVLAIITWLSLVMVAAWTGFTRLAIALGLSLAIAVAGLLAWRQRRKAEDPGPLATLVGLRAERKGRRLGPLVASGRDLIAVLRRSLSDVRLQTRMAIAGSAIFALAVVAQWSVFESLGTPVRLMVAAATIAVGLAAGLFTGTPGGIATTEAAMVGLYVTLGIDNAEAAAGVLLYRGLHYLLVLAWGLPSLVFCGLSRGGPRRTTTELAGEALPGSERPVAGSRPDPAG